ncbi:hypothetical protein ACNTMW_24780 [Planosporangium sp. 12N6]|uniref:hypothetical protein n=1 Tax=Planosporangium spinosum TaxID=3402278 RepID=UPI003CF3CF55
MAFAVLFLIVLALLLATTDVAPSVVRWIARQRRRDTTGLRPRSPGQVDAQTILEVIFRADSHGERVEAVLTTWLLAGALSGEEYRQEMAVLAARDALRHPLVAPPHRDL